MEAGKAYRLRQQDHAKSGSPVCRWCHKTITPSSRIGMAPSWYHGTPDPGRAQFHSNGCAIAFAHWIVENLDAGGSFEPTNQLQEERR